MNTLSSGSSWPTVPGSPGTRGGRGGQGPLGTATRLVPVEAFGLRAAWNSFPAFADWERKTAFVEGWERLSQGGEEGGEAAAGAGAAGPGATSPAPAALATADASTPIFKANVLKVTFPASRQKVEEEVGRRFWKGVVHHCKHWMCEECKLSRGLALKGYLMSKAALFKVPRLYTVTVNRVEWFDSPEDAYNHVMGKKFLARLLTKEMGVRVWLWVLEAQEKNGDGWPHWHILMDVSELPGRWYHKGNREARATKPTDSRGWVYIPHFFDLNRVHRLLLKWKIGKQCKLSVSKEALASPEHAINYIMKYLIKMPERGYPPWMYHHHRLRFVQGSRALGQLTENKYQGKCRQQFPLEIKPKEREPVERIAECGSRMSFIIYDERQDRHIVYGSFYGQKEMLKTCPHAVTVQEFDFTRHKPFEVYGFTSFADVQRFEKAVTAPAIVAQVEDDIRKKRERLLSMWDNSGG